MKKIFTLLSVFTLLAAFQLKALDLDDFTKSTTFKSRLAIKADSSGDENSLIDQIDRDFFSSDEDFIVLDEFAKSDFKITASKFRKASQFLQEDLLFNDNSLSVRKVYPNPANAVAFVDYSLIEDITAKITIRNLLGKVVKEYDLVKGERKIRIPTVSFDPGVYFYSLSINGKPKRTNKLIVKHD